MSTRVGPIVCSIWALHLLGLPLDRFLLSTLQAPVFCLPIIRKHPGNPCKWINSPLALEDVHWPSASRQPPLYPACAVSGYQGVLNVLEISFKSPLRPLLSHCLHPSSQWPVIACSLPTFLSSYPPFSLPCYLPGADCPSLLYEERCREGEWARQEEALKAEDKGMLRDGQIRECESLKFLLYIGHFDREPLKCRGFQDLTYKIKIKHIDNILHIIYSACNIKQLCMWTYVRTTGCDI